jgi:hypothetical protein
VGNSSSNSSSNRRAFAWCVRYNEFTRQRHHVGCELVYDEAALPPVAWLQANNETIVAPDLPVKTDEELDAAEGTAVEVGLARRRVRAKRMLQPAASAASVVGGAASSGQQEQAVDPGGPEPSRRGSSSCSSSSSSSSSGSKACSAQQGVATVAEALASNSLGKTCSVISSKYVEHGRLVNQPASQASHRACASQLAHGLCCYVV